MMTHFTTAYLTTTTVAAAGTTTTFAAAAGGGAVTIIAKNTNILDNLASYGKTIFEFCVKKITYRMKKEAIKSSILLSNPNISNEEADRRAERIITGLDVVEVIYDNF